VSRRHFNTAGLNVWRVARERYAFDFAVGCPFCHGWRLWVFDFTSCTIRYYTLCNGYTRCTAPIPARIVNASSNRRNRPNHITTVLPTTWPRRDCECGFAHRTFLWCSLVIWRRNGLLRRGWLKRCCYNNNYYCSKISKYRFLSVVKIMFVI